MAVLSYDRLIIEQEIDRINEYLAGRNLCVQNMILIALDCDGSIEIGNPAGPISVDRLNELNIPPYIQIVVVSASPFCTRLPYPRFVSENTRLENLLAAAIHYPSTLNIYVSDNPGDDIVARTAGFVYVHPKNFHFPLK